MARDKNSRGLAQFQRRLIFDETGAEDLSSVSPSGLPAALRFATELTGK